MLKGLGKFYRDSPKVSNLKIPLVELIFEVDVSGCQVG